jgi:uncharacterized protein
VEVSDHLALFGLVSPGQILFGSDIPYGRTVAAAALVLRAALAAGLSAEQSPPLAAVSSNACSRTRRPRTSVRH